MRTISAYSNNGDIREQGALQVPEEPQAARARVHECAPKTRRLRSPPTVDGMEDGDADNEAGSDSDEDGEDAGAGSGASVGQSSPKAGTGNNSMVCISAGSSSSNNNNNNSTTSSSSSSNRNSRPPSDSLVWLQENGRRFLTRLLTPYFPQDRLAQVAALGYPVPPNALALFRRGPYPPDPPLNLPVPCFSPSPCPSPLSLPPPSPTFSIFSSPMSPPPLSPCPSPLSLPPPESPTPSGSPWDESDEFSDEDLDLVNERHVDGG